MIGVILVGVAKNSGTEVVMISKNSVVSGGKLDLRDCKAVVDGFRDCNGVVVTSTT